MWLLQTIFCCRLNSELVREWLVDKKHIIGLVELYAVVLARYHWNDVLTGRRVVFFVDNIPSMRSLIEGTSTDKQWRRLLRSIEVVEMEGPTYSWFARVPSHSNPSDDASRLNFDVPWLKDARPVTVILPPHLSQWGVSTGAPEA